MMGEALFSCFCSATTWFLTCPLKNISGVYPGILPQPDKIPNKTLHLKSKNRQMPVHSCIYRLWLALFLLLMNFQPVPAQVIPAVDALGSKYPDIYLDEATKETPHTDVVAWYDDCSGNIPNITNHYIVIRGKKYDAAKKQWYYLFYEVGTGSSNNGKSFENRLYINSNNNIIEENTAYKMIILEIIIKLQK
jgi:hypothetical protein